MTRVLAIVAIIVAARSARADDGALGFRIAGGELPLADTRPTVVSIAVGTEQELAHGWRGFGEFEYMWFEKDKLTTGSGSRVQLGVRHVLAERTIESTIRLYIDGELGGGMALVSNTTVQAVPDGFAGLRLGYDIVEHADRSPSQKLQLELSLRALYVPDGLGLMGGIGVWWGN